MQYIGFMADICENELDPKIAGYARRMRAVPMAAYLKEQGIELFIYSIRNVDPKTKLASGFIIQNKKLCPITAPIPKVNGDWYYGTYPYKNIKSPSYNEFHKFAKDNRIEIYPSRKLAKMISNKFLTYKLVYQYCQSAQPFTELFDGSLNQIKRFLSQSKLIFLKPIYGDKGNKIFTIKREGENCKLTFYENKVMKVDYYPSLNILLSQVVDMIKKGNYIIQEGINMKRYNDESFIIRAILMHDGEQWQWNHKFVLTNNKGDVANMTQNGVSFTLEDFLPKIFSEEKLEDIYTNIKKFSFNLADYLNPEEKEIEIAFDLVIDKDGDIFFLEMNYRPGMLMPGMDPKKPFKNIYNLDENEQVLYDKYCATAGKYMGRYLQCKLEGRLKKEQ